MSNRQPKVNAEMLAAAVCKLEGFTYAPNADQLQALSDEVGENRSLLMCCAAYRGGADLFRNLTLKKIPKIVLTKCEWGHDDYSLIVQNLPMAVPSPAESSSTANSGRAAKVANPAQGGLFAGENA